MPHYSPLRYPGGKNCIFTFMTNFLAENNLLDSNYAEPYAGGCGLALHLLFEEYVQNIYINDLDISIYAFWKVVLDDSEKFCDWIKHVDISMKSWKHFKEIQNSREQVNDFELAQSTFFLNRTNISGVIKGGVIGGQDQNGKYKMNARFNKSSLIEKIKKIARFQNRIYLSQQDGLEFIKTIEKRIPDIFIYLDPPYFEKGSSLYLNFYKEDDHKRLAERVVKLKNNWMVSYDNNNFILNLYKNQNCVSYSLFQSASNRIGREILIFSDNLNYVKSSLYLKNHIFIEEPNA